jgi:hypothetical protein
METIRPTSGTAKRVADRGTLDQSSGVSQRLKLACARLLGRAPPSQVSTVESGPGSSEERPLVDLVPSLCTMLASEGLDAGNLSVALETDDRGHIRVVDRHSVPVSDGKKLVFWPVASLRELCRGNRPAPADMDHYPPEYCAHFYFIENHLITACDAQGDRTDQELEEIYSTLRRRPDGRSLGTTHDFLWQVAALVLGTHPLSQLEFEAIFSALTSSTRKWGQRPVSRNYVDYLRTVLPD